jgi:aconitate hydratase
VKAVVAKSIERIHAANLVNFGILPLTFADPADYDLLAQGDEVELPGVAARLERGQPLSLVDDTKGVTMTLRHDLSPRQRDIILAGGLLAYTVR